jgi:HD-GYP domain-containing protein (c-di-GMP phosphodiesterase class II)
MSMSNDYETIPITNVPRTDAGHSLVDLYVHFPYSKKYVKFLVAGDILDDRRIEALKKHKDPRLFIRAGSLLSAEALQNNPDSLEKIKRPELELQTPSERIKEELKQIFGFLQSDPEKAQTEAEATLAKMEKVADDVLAEVAPDVEDLRKFLISNSKYVMLMADSSAIASIAVMTALAHGFDSRAIFRDLSMASILMDAPLSDMSEESIVQYYLDPSKLDRAVYEKIMQHPIVSAQALTVRIKAFSQTVLQLILGHHELYNGKGYPKGTRSEMLPPVVRSFSLAVDIFGIMKREKLKSKEISMLDAAQELQEKNIEAHLRRHNQRLVTSLINFIKSNMELIGVSDEDLKHME